MSEIVPFEDFAETVGRAARKKSETGMPLEEAVREAERLGIEKGAFLEAHAELHEERYAIAPGEKIRRTIETLGKYTSFALAGLNYPTANRIAKENDIETRGLVLFSVMEAWIGVSGSYALFETSPALAVLTGTAVIVGNTASGLVELYRKSGETLRKEKKAAYLARQEQRLPGPK